MMKIIFISDIHGSLYYTKKALEVFENEKADYLAILGDELYHGPRNPLPLEYDPMGVAELLNQYKDKIIAVKGNCDSEVDELVINYPVMAPAVIVLYNGRRLFLTHGHIYNENNLPNLNDGDVLLFGHIHLPVAKKKDNIYILNPGSIALPKDNNPSTYGILDNNVFRIKDFEGNTVKEMIFS